MTYRIVFCLLFAWTSAFADDDAPVKPTITDADKASIVGSGNDFASDLYGALRSEKGNFFFSPESITEALALTFAGARGQTANEMQAVLHLRMNTDYTAAALGELLKEKNARSARGNYSFRVANALWVQKDYELLPAYLEQVNNAYAAKAENIDFEGNRDQAAVTINRWVEEKTEHKIKNLATADAVGSARLVLTNAVYFKADWNTPFKKSDTRQEEFYMTPSQNNRVWMMKQTCHQCQYTQNEDYQALAIPYKGEDIEMVVFLPRDKNGLGDFEQNLNPQTLREGLEALKPGTNVDLFLPRFHLESAFSLKEPLSALGMKTAFDDKHAEFAGMTGKNDLYISEVIHKAYVDVDETGTEAAAATAVTMMPTAMPVHEAVPEFRADHPFLFLLRDMHTGAVYFMGRVKDPAG